MAFLICISCKKTKTIYYKSGEIEAIIENRNDTLNYAKFYYKNGVIKAEGFMDTEGRFENQWKEYYSDGKIKWIGKYNNGEPIVLINSKWPDFNNANWHIEIDGNSDTLIVNKTYKARIIAPEIYPDMLYFTYNDYTEIEKNKDPKTLNCYPYIIKAESPGELLLLLTLPDENGNYIRFKSTSVTRLFVKAK